MLNQDPKAKFQQDMAEFDMSAAFRRFMSDNISLCFLLLTVAAIAAVSSGAKSVLTHRRVGTILLVIMVCRAFHAGVTANRPGIVIKDVTPEKEDENGTDKDS